MAHLHILPGSHLVTNVVPGNTVFLPVLDPRRDAHWTPTANPANQMTNLAVPYQAPQYQGVLIDPLETALAWLTPLHESPKTFIETIRKQSFILVHSILRHRLWDRQELVDWIVATCVKDVFIQWHDHTENWRLTFLAAEDLEAFKVWWHQPKPHPLTLCYKEASDLALIERWISENVSGEMETDPSFQRAENGFKRTFRFRRIEDAVLSKLRFSEMVTEASDKDEYAF